MPWRDAERLPDRFHRGIAEWLFRAQAQRQVEANELPISADVFIPHKCSHPRISAPQPPAGIGLQNLIHAASINLPHFGVNQIFPILGLHSSPLWVIFILRQRDEEEHGSDLSQSIEPRRPPCSSAARDIEAGPGHEQSGFKQQRMGISMARIEKLTPEQEAMLPAVRDEWLRHGLSTEPADCDAAEQAVKDAYVVAGLEPPKIIIRLASPHEGAIGAAILKGTNLGDSVRAQVGAQVWDQVGAQVWDQVRAQVGAQVRAQVGAAFWSQHEAGWLSHLAYFARVMKLPNTDKIEPLLRVAQACGWVWFFRGAAIISDRPKTLNRDEQNRLHCEDGPALEYRDGFSINAWHGTRVPKEWIEDKTSVTPKIALTWQNIEQRRCAIEIVGWAKILRELDAKVIDADGDPLIGTLVEVRLPDLDRAARFCRVQCGTGREFAVGVPPEIKTAIEAQAWMIGVQPSEFVRPEVRT
jgi:hypothetical protein